MSDDPDVDAEVPDADARVMVQTLRSDWEVTGIDRQPHGTDFVATVELDTPGGRPQRAVLKATTAGLVGELARGEPRLLELVGERTDVPVPTVYGYRDEHDSLPAPFFLLSHEPGVNFEGEVDRLGRSARERVVREAGRNLAALHGLGPLPAVGTIGVRDGELTVLDTDEHPRYEDDRDYARESGLEAVATLDEGGFFPQFADDEERFADLMPTLRTTLRERAAELPEPVAPTYCHRDYRYGNLLVDPQTGETEAVLDWAGALSVEPAYNLAIAESLLLGEPGEQGTERLRRAFRSAYADEREGWAFDEEVRERMAYYGFVSRLHAMACLPLWHREADAAERDDVEAHHREFVEQYLNVSLER